MATKLIVYWATILYLASLSVLFILFTYPKSITRITRNQVFKTLELKVFYQLTHGQN